MTIEEDNVQKIFSDLSHHDIQVLGYFKNGPIKIETQMVSSGLADSMDELKLLGLISFNDKTYKLTDKGKNALRHL